MSALPASLPEHGDPLAGLADCVRRLDPGTRALLDLSVRRRLRDDAMAPLLRTDPFHLAWRRARALERVASDLGGDQPLPLGQVRAALESLPVEAWDPLGRPALGPGTADAPDGETTERPPTTALVPVAAGELAPAPPARLSARLDAFASSAPTLRQAFGMLGRAVGRKFVRTIVRRGVG